MIDNQLRYFIVAARHEHLGRAAEELGLSQPTLSRSISRLESEYQSKLFDRAGRRMRISPAGRLLLAHAERVVAELDDAHRALKDIKSNAKQVIALGFLATFAVSLVPDLMRRFKATNPMAQFRLLQGPYPQLQERLVGGEIDLCLSSPRFVDSNFAWRPLFDEELVLIVPRGHPLENRAQIDLSEIAREPIIALKKGFGLRQVLDDVTRQAGFVPDIAFEGEEVATLHGLVGAGFGVALVPKGVTRNSDLVKSVVVREPFCRRTIGLSWRQGRYLPRLTERFREHIIASLCSSRRT